jgi:hypothetical protein
VPKHMLVKLVRKEQERAEEDRGDKAPVLLARQNRLAKRLGRASRGYVLAGAGVVVGAVVVVSLLSWLAPDSDRPVGHPLEVVERVADGVLEQVDEQVATLLGTEEGTVLRDVRENLTAVGSRIPWSGRASEITPNRSAVSSSPTAPAPTIHPTLNTPVQKSPRRRLRTSRRLRTRRRRAARARRRHLSQSLSQSRSLPRHGRADNVASCNGRAPYSSSHRRPSPYHGGNLTPQRSLPLHPEKSPFRRGASHRRGSSDRASSHGRGTSTAPNRRAAPYHGPATTAADRARLRRRVVRSGQRPAGVLKRSRPFSSSSSSPAPRDTRSRPLSWATLSKLRIFIVF